MLVCRACRVAFLLVAALGNANAWLPRSSTLRPRLGGPPLLAPRWARRATATRPTQDAAQSLPCDTRLVRVITDIDDTVKSSGNLRLAGLIPLGGIDAQYERGEFYPGVFQFALELATHGSPAGMMPLPVAVLTARAKEFLWALELKQEHPVSRAYRQCGVDNGFQGWGLGPVLYGSVKEWIFSMRKAKRKFRNFKKLMEQDGTEAHARGCVTDYIFIGDTGEGDTKAGTKMCETFPQELRAMFLHIVSCDTEYCITPEDCTINGVPVLFFKTYVGAARKAYQVGLLDKRAVRRVIDTAVQELEASGAPQGSSKWEDLEMDIEETLQMIRLVDPSFTEPLKAVHAISEVVPAMADGVPLPVQQ